VLDAYREARKPVAINDTTSVQGSPGASNSAASERDRATAKTYRFSNAWYGDRSDDDLDIGAAPPCYGCETIRSLPYAQDPRVPLHSPQGRPAPLPRPSGYDREGREERPVEYAY
ncbi:hypothetical protein FOZ63_022325, partial [Perkinsus olseni]